MQEAAGFYYGFTAGIEMGHISFAICNEVDEFYLESIGGGSQHALPYAQWNHICIQGSFNGVTLTIKLYLNNVLADTMSSAYTIFSMGTPRSYFAGDNFEISWHDEMCMLVGPNAINPALPAELYAAGNGGIKITPDWMTAKNLDGWSCNFDSTEGQPVFQYKNGETEGSGFGVFGGFEYAEGGVAIEVPAICTAPFLRPFGSPPADSWGW
ncbi:MAG: hypothetical protein A2Y07_06890 [Planctomycetes bacterium GWF2_50_10]|nr:MAG: hypothetical protein A2Y07_06890 [Planctomycetes bacterium GWF2_50_10]